MEYVEKYEKLVKTIEDLKADVDKFFVRGNNAAGGRVRKGLQEVKKLSQELRVDVQTYKNSLKEKK